MPAKQKRAVKTKARKIVRRVARPVAAKSKAKQAVSQVRRQTTVAKQSLQGRLDQVNRVVNRFEKEFETLFKKLVKQGERSRKDLRKNFDEIAKKVRKGKLLKEASATREELEKEVRRVAEEVVATIKEAENLINTEKVTAIFSEVRGSVNGLVEVLSRNGVITQVKQAIESTRKEVLGIFKIPSQNEVEKLEKKIITLEKRLSNLSRKAA